MTFVVRAPAGGSGSWKTAYEQAHICKIVNIWDIGPQMKKNRETGDEKQEHHAVIGVDVDPKPGEGYCAPNGEIVTAFTTVNLSVRKLEKAGITAWLKLLFPGEDYKALEGRWAGGIDLSALSGLDIMATLTHQKSEPTNPEYDPWHRYYIGDPKPLPKMLKEGALETMLSNPDVIPDVVERKRKYTVGGWDAYANGQG